MGWRLRGGSPRSGDPSCTGIGSQDYFTGSLASKTFGVIAELRIIRILRVRDWTPLPDLKSDVFGYDLLKNDCSLNSDRPSKTTNKTHTSTEILLNPT